MVMRVLVSEYQMKLTSSEMFINVLFLLFFFIYSTHLKGFHEFDNQIELKPDDEFVFVQCNTDRLLGSAMIYEDAFAFIRRKHNKVVSKPDKEEHQKSRKLNVLIVGIDSISRLHLIRAMPKTFDFLQKRKLIDYKLYNKVLATISSL